MIIRVTLMAGITMFLLAAGLGADDAGAAISGKRAKAFATEIAAFGP